MMSTPLRLFESAVAQYAQYRSGYPSDDVDLLAAQVGLDVGGRALDIGCGTGQLTLPLARHAGAVVAIDPIAGMLAHGRDAARAAGLTNITWVQGDSARLIELIEPGFELAAFAASFHWTERATVVEALDMMAVSASRWSWARQLTVDQVIGLQLSYSFSTPALLGERVDAFSREVRDAVLALHPGGVVTEQLRVEVILASRP